LGSTRGKPRRRDRKWRRKTRLRARGYREAACWTVV